MVWYIPSILLTSFHAMHPLVCKAPTILGSDGTSNILSYFRNFVLMGPLISRFHPLSLSLNITYSKRPSLTVLARVAPTLLSLTELSLTSQFLTTSCFHYLLMCQSFIPLSYSLTLSCSPLWPWRPEQCLSPSTRLHQYLMKD